MKTGPTTRPDEIFLWTIYIFPNLFEAEDLFPAPINFIIWTLKPNKGILINTFDLKTQNKADLLL